MTKVLVIGAGPSVDYDYIKKFKGIRIAVDRIYKPLLEHGITPEYSVTYEKGLISSNGNVINTHFKILYEGLPKTKTKFIFASTSNEDIYNNMVREGHDCTLWDHKMMRAVNNVGLFAWFYAVEELKADFIDMIGMDHLKTDFPERPIKCQWMREIFFELKNFYATNTNTVYLNEPITN